MRIFLICGLVVSFLAVSSYAGCGERRSRVLTCGQSLAVKRTSRILYRRARRHIKAAPRCGSVTYRASVTVEASSTSGCANGACSISVLEWN